MSNDLLGAGLVNAIAALKHPESKIHELARGQKLLVIGDKHHIVGDKRLAEPKTLSVSTLNAVAEAMRSELVVGDASKVVIHVISPRRVDIVTPHTGDEAQQFTYVTSNAIIPRLEFGCYMDLDTFITSLHANFLPSDDRTTLLEYAGGISAVDKSEIVDDGVAQSATMRSSVTRIASVELKNPVQLAPFRTFAEIAQPFSRFVFRVRKVEGAKVPTVEAGLFEADGGAWGGEAIRSIGAWLKAELTDAVVLA